MKHEVLTKSSPTNAQWKDIQFGWQIAKEMKRLNIGQTVTVKNLSVVAIEASEGTDACIQRSGGLCRGFSVVMTTEFSSFEIGPIKNIAESGGKVLAFHVDQSFSADHQEMREMIDYANQLGVILVGLQNESND